MRVEIYDDNGLVSVSDDRTLAACKEEQVVKIKRWCAESILKAAPEFKQANAALRLLDEEEATAIKLAIQTRRNKSNELELEVISIQAIDATEEEKIKANAKVDAIVWPEDL